MHAKTFYAFCEHSRNIPQTLARAVVAQFGGWKNFEESAPDVTRHGISGGFGDFIYCTDTVAFAEKHRADILALCEDMRDSMGEPDTLAAFIAGFACLPEYKAADVEAVLLGTPKDESDTTQVFNALAWFAGEEVARAYVDALEDQQ